MGVKKWIPWNLSAPIVAAGRRRSGLRESGLQKGYFNGVSAKKSPVEQKSDKSQSIFVTHPVYFDHVGGSFL